MLIRYKEVCAGQQKFLTVWRELLMGHCVSNGPGRDARLVKIHLPLCWLCLLELWVRWVFTRRFPPWRPGRSRDCTNTGGKAQTHSSHWETTVWTVGHHGFWACFGRKTIWVWEKLNLNIIIQIIYLTRHLEEKKKNRDQPARILTIGLYYWGSCTQYSSVTVFKMRRWQDFPRWDVGQESFLVCFCRSAGVENEKMSFKNYLKYDFSQGLKDACQKDADSRAEAWRKRKSSCLKVQWKDEF